MDVFAAIASVYGATLVLALGTGLVIGYQAARHIWQEEVAAARAVARAAENRARSAADAERQLRDRYDALLDTPHGELVQELVDERTTTAVLMRRLAELDSGPLDALMHAIQTGDLSDPPDHGRPPARHRRPRPAAVRPYAAEIPPAAPTGPGHN